MGGIMAHFAQIDENNSVLQVIVVPNEQEHRGNEYLNELGLTGTWIQTSYNANIRGKYAGPGDIYDAENDEFIPKPLTEEELAVIAAKLEKAAEEAAEEAARLSAKLAIYAKLGLTEEEINTLIS
jgi:hypothetical protein